MRKLPGPARWWPGSNYVTWVGIDGYYYAATDTFASVFGPVLHSIRRVTHDPILITETGVAPAAGKAAKIPDLFAGVHADHLLGLVWFDSHGNQDWRIDGNPAALTAFRKAAAKLRKEAAR